MTVCRRGIVAQVGSPPAPKFICVARNDVQAHSQAAVEITIKKRRTLLLSVKCGGQWCDPCGGDRVVQRRGIVAPVGSPWRASFVCVLLGDKQPHSAAHSRTCDQEKINSAKMCVF